MLLPGPSGPYEVNRTGGAGAARRGVSNTALFRGAMAYISDPMAPSISRAPTTRKGSWRPLE